MARRDHYYEKSKREGYRSRAAYKLKQLHREATLVSPGDTVVDLGAAPGGWLQVAVELAEGGRVLGVDRQSIEPVEGADTLRGDLTDEETWARIRERVGEADVVLSDVAPNMTGEYELDHARSVHLARQAFAVATDILAGGGDFVVKVFEGPDLAAFRDELAREFDHVRTVRPDATRSASSEVYLVAKRRLTAPVRAGDVLEVTVEDVGAEGDGVAKVDGFTVFVPGTEAGEVVTVRVDEVKPRFAFAARVD